MAKEKERIEALVGRLPDADRPGEESKFTGPDPKAAEEILEAVLAQGRAGIKALLDLVKEPTDPAFKNYKAEYLLHCLSVYLGRPEKRTARKPLVEELTERIGDSEVPNYLRGLFIRELQVTAGEEAVEALGARLLDDELCEYATQALLAIGGESAVAALRKAFRKAEGWNRVTLAQALGVVADSRSVPELRDALRSTNRDLRIAAAWALARIGAESAVADVIGAAERKSGWERIQATSACFLLAEKLAASGKKEKAKSIYMHLRAARKDPSEAYVRDAADAALKSLGA